jgi:hypothetical protein
LKLKKKGRFLCFWFYFLFIMIVATAIATMMRIVASAMYMVNVSLVSEFVVDVGGVGFVVPPDTVTTKPVCAADQKYDLVPSKVAVIV